MASKYEQFDDADDEQLAWLLSTAHGAPAMREEFVNSLSKRLDADFAADRHLNNGDGKPSPSMNGASQESAAAAAVDIDPGLKPRSFSRTRRRWTIGIATAASLSLAAVVWSNPPAVAIVFRALVSTIQSFTSGDGPQKAAIPAENVIAGGAKVDATPREALATKPAEATSARRAAAAEPPTVLEDASTPDKRPTTDSSVSHSPEPKWTPFDEPLADAELTQRIDDSLARLWQSNGIKPVHEASDAEFMRRLYLDLTGRIPSVSEAQTFLEDTAPNRRELLVDRLLAHRDHATHLAAVWRGILLPSTVDLSRVGGPAKFDQWLADRFEANAPYDQIVRELLLAQGRVTESGPLLFYAALKLNPEELAARTSRAFLGVRMDCAQCHDHPDEDTNISQHDFWSFAAFFAQISRPRGKMEMTSPVLQVRDNKRGEVTIPESDEVVPPRLPLSASDISESADGPARRQQLVDWLTSTHNGQFARAAVNRAWASLFGRGLVEPVDDMRPANKPIAPEVLETLSRDFAASKFDLRRLLRAMVLTKTYQLSSQSPESDPAKSLHFAQMNIKSFTAEQLYDCITVATRQAVVSNDATGLTGLERIGDMSRDAFIAQFRAPDGHITDYHAGIPQALTLMHGGLIHSATDLATSGLLKSLAAPFFTDDQRLDTLFLSTLSRYPDPAEREVMMKAVKAAKTDPDRQQALGDVLWALLNSAEFSFNH
jgi:hypothetical protein